MLSKVPTKTGPDLHTAQPIPIPIGFITKY
jgi:hypothetical protein